MQYKPPDRPVKQWSHKEIEQYLGWLATLAPITEAEYGAAYAIPASLVPAAKATACEHEIEKSKVLINTIRPKADAGDAEAIKLVAQIEAFIERMTISRQYWAQWYRRKASPAV